MRHLSSLSQIEDIKNKIAITSSKEEVADWRGSPLDLLACFSL